MEGDNDLFQTTTLSIHLGIFVTTIGTEYLGEESGQPDSQTNRAISEQK
jgi:hypothetical protein